MDKTIEWLLGSDPWVEYRTRIDLLGQSVNDEEVIRAKQRLKEHPMIRQIISELLGWSDEVITNHKKAGMWLHKLSFLAEIGLRADDDEVLKRITQQMMERINAFGVVPVMVNVPKAFGGSGENTLAWSMCDGPLLMYCLVKMGYHDRLKDGSGYLANLVRDNGWPCVSSAELGRFRGPGKKADPCPYGTLLMLKLLAQFDNLKNSEPASSGVQSLLRLWEASREESPYLFKMGTDFRKLKAPFVWYDILHVADALTQFEWIREDVRLLEMVKFIADKADESGRFTPESQWMKWKGFEFAQKKQVSPWVTFLALRIAKRMRG